MSESNSSGCNESPHPKEWSDDCTQSFESNELQDKLRPQNKLEAEAGGNRPRKVQSEGHEPQASSAVGFIKAPCSGFLSGKEWCETCPS